MNLNLLCRLIEYTQYGYDKFEVDYVHMHESRLQ